MSKKGLPSLAEQRYELIQQHIIDPENSPLPAELKEQFSRVLQVARLMDDYPNESHIINIMLAKYRVSTTQIRKDIGLARELFKTNLTFVFHFIYYFMKETNDQFINLKRLFHKTNWIR